MGLFLIFSLVGCTVSPLADFKASTQLFAEHTGSDGVNGVAGILLTDAEIDCKQFQNGLEANDLWRAFSADKGILIVLSYAYQESPDTDAWVGTFAPGAYEPDMVDNSVVHYTRSATSAWFDGRDWFPESSGLVVNIDEYASDKVKGDFQHIWDSRSIKAETCGSYGSKR